MCFLSREPHPCTSSALTERPIMRANIPIIFIALISWTTSGKAQPQNSCSQIKYIPPPAQARRYRLSRVEGQAVYASPSNKWELGVANGVCAMLFNRTNGEVVAALTTDDRGQFEFAGIAPGDYVLIAFAGDLQKISVPIQLLPGENTVKSQRLLLHLREKEDPRKSYVTAVTNLRLRKELIALVKQDQNIRDEMIRSGVDHPDKTIMARMDAIDSQNTARMRSVIKEVGWPGADLVGWDGTEAAFTLIQHAAHSFHKELLPVMQKKFKSGDLSGPNYALFLDRLLVESGKLQVYGSKAKPFEQWKGEPSLYPIADEANVDKRRAEVGLSTLAEYREFLKRMYYPQDK